MKKYIFILPAIFLYFAGVCQTTNAAVSDSIDNQMSVLGYDTLIQPLETFYTSGGDLYVYFSQVSGGQFKALSHSVAPNVFKFNDFTLTKSWHVYEVDNWLLGATGTNYGGYSCSGGGTRTCTITISGDTWNGSSTNDSDALGLAFYHFLLDPDFATYLQ